MFRGLPAERIYRVTLQDARERYVATDRPYELVDGRWDIETCVLVEGEDLTPRALCSLLVDRLGLEWPEYQRKLAVDALMRGEKLDHAVATAQRKACFCPRCSAKAQDWVLI